jgi:hypothetical protein
MTGGLSSGEWPDKCCAVLLLQHEHAVLAVRGAFAESLCRLWIGQSTTVQEDQCTILRLTDAFQAHI